MEVVFEISFFFCSNMDIEFIEKSLFGGVINIKAMFFDYHQETYV